MAAFENCEIFSTYYFSHIQSYKVALKGGNYWHNEKILDSFKPRLYLRYKKVPVWTCPPPPPPVHYL